MAQLIHSTSFSGFETAFPNWAQKDKEGYSAVTLTDDGFLITHGKKWSLTHIQLTDDYTGNSTSLAASQKALNDVYKYAQGLLAAKDALHYEGSVSGSNKTDGNNYGTLFPTNTTTIDKGATFKVITSGYINGIAVEVGDMLICNTDNPTVATSSNYTTVSQEWDIIQTNLDPTTFVTLTGDEIITGVKTFTVGTKYKQGNYTNTLYTKDLTTDVNTYLPKEGGYLLYKDSVNAVGGTTQPVYIDSTGKAVTIGYTIQTSVPANALFTDTLYNVVQGTNVTVSESTVSGVKTFTISSSNTWRDIQAYSLNGTTLSSASIDQGTLKFGNSLLATLTKENNKIVSATLNLCWAEVDDSGNITYVS